MKRKGKIVKQKYDVSKYTDYVKARVLTKYHSFPEQVRNAMGIDDCVQEALLYLHKVLNNKGNIQVTFDETKSKLTTWIFIVLDGYFNNLIKAHLRKKRAAVLVSLDALEMQFGTKENITSKIALDEAREKISELHLQASQDLMVFIANNLYTPTKKLRVNVTPRDFKYVVNPYTKGLRKVPCKAAEVIAKRKQEFRNLANKLNVTPDHYRMVLRAEL